MKFFVTRTISDGAIVTKCVSSLKIHFVVVATECDQYIYIYIFFFFSEEECDQLLKHRLDLFLKKKKKKTYS